MATEQSSLPPLEADIYNFIHTYDFSSDLEFRKGLGIILGHPVPASDAEVTSNDDVVLQAKCFYISRFVWICANLEFAVFKLMLYMRGLKEAESELDSRLQGL